MTNYSDPKAGDEKARSWQLKRAGHNEAALVVAMRAAARWPHEWRTQLDAGDLLMEAGRYSEAAHYMSRAQYLAPSRSEPYEDQGLLCLYRGELAAALQYMTKASEMKGGLSHETLAGIVHLAAGNWDRGWPKYLKSVGNINMSLSYAPLYLPMWLGEPLEGKRLAVIADQGSGDLFMAERYLPWLRALLPAKLDLYVHASQRQLFKGHHSVDRIRLVGDKVAADAYCWAGLLPALHGTRTDNVPPCTGHFQSVAAELGDVGLTRTMGGRFRLGIVWAGREVHNLDRWRSATLEPFLTLAELPEPEIFSFQVGPRSADLAKAGVEGLITDLSPQLKSWADTAAALIHMDLVVGVDTGTMHLAGALGVPCFLLNAAAPDWRWMIGDGKTPWYPSMFMYRQRRLGDWAEVIGRVKTRLEADFATLAVA